MTCLRNVKFLSSDCDNTGDHYAMSKSMNFVVRNVSELSSCDLAPVSHPQWNNKSFLNAYEENLRLGLQVIEPVKLEGLSKDTAQISVNRLNKQLCETMHNSVSASVSECDQKKNKVNKWWNYNCTQARNRYRNFTIFGIHVADQVVVRCITAIDPQESCIERLVALQLTIKQIRHSNAIALSSLEEYFKLKFDIPPEEPESVKAMYSVVDKKYDSLHGKVDSSFVFSEHSVKKYIKQLKSGTAAGVDGIQQNILKLHWTPSYHSC